MEKGWVLKKYAYFYGAIEKLGGFETMDVTIADLQMPKGQMQTAYNDIAKTNFESGCGSLIDYLCWVSTEYYLMGISEDTAKVNDIVNVMINDCLVRKTPEAINFIRLAHSNPMHYLTSPWYEKINESFGNKMLGLVIAFTLNAIWIRHFCEYDSSHIYHSFLDVAKEKLAELLKDK